MFRNALCACGILVLIATTGCGLFAKKPVDVAMDEPPYGYEMTALADRDPAPAESYPVYEPSVQPAAPEPDPISLAATAPREHIVARHDTLYSIARKYYGDQRKWKEIYAANRDTIADPNMIRVGQRLVLP